MTIVVMRMRTWRDVHVVHLIFPKWISEFSLTSHSTCAEWIIFMHVFCFLKLTQYQISMTVKKTTILFDDLKLIDNIYIYIYIVIYYIYMPGMVSTDNTIYQIPYSESCSDDINVYSQELQ